MAPSVSDDPAPRTIADLAPSDQRLGLTCGYCGRFRYLRHTNFPGSAEISAIATELKCARCGSDDVVTRAIARDAKSGYWPAEFS